MSKSFKKIFILACLLLGLFQFPANAQNTTFLPLIEITAEYYPNEIYHIGLELNSDHSLNRVFYENELNVKRFYSLDNLRDRTVMMTTHSGGKIYNLVYLTVKSVDNGKYIFTISYMRNGLFKTGSIKNAYYTVNYIPSVQSYNVVDNQSDREISRANITTNYWLSQPVGIDKIVTN